MIETLETTTGPPMSAGTYITKRRDAAGISIEQASARILRWSSDYVATSLRMMEADEPLPADLDLDRMLIELCKLAFSFDPYVYHALVGAASDPSQPVPAICRRCACSEYDPCDPPCGWAEQDLCTACDEPTPVQCAAAHGAAIAAGVVAFAMVPGQWLLATAAQGFAA